MNALILRARARPFVLLAALCLLLPVPAAADSWAMPSTQTVSSPSGSYRLTVEPAPIGSQLKYFEEELEADQKGEQVERPAPLAMLERRLPSGAYEPVWARPLVNRVAPAWMLLRDDGGRIVTFDNWGSVGHGDHVIVIYDGAGVLVRSLRLADVLPQNYIDALPHSVSSLNWRNDARISPDGNFLEIDIMIPAYRNARETVPRLIDLRDGTIPPAAGYYWSYALQQAQMLTDQRLEDERKRLAFLTDPLPAPAADDQAGWQAYLREASLRLTPNYLDRPYPATRVLFGPDHPRLAESVGWIVEDFRQASNSPQEMAVAAPLSPESLVQALGAGADAVPSGSLTGSIVYVSIPADHRAAAQQQVERSGARFIWLDPASTIPQRAERVPGSAEEAAAEEEMMRREMAGMREALQGFGD